jgi:hypothetical protein
LHEYLALESPPHWNILGHGMLSLLPTVTLFLLLKDANHSLLPTGLGHTLQQWHKTCADSAPASHNTVQYSMIHVTAFMFIVVGCVVLEVYAGLLHKMPMMMEEGLSLQACWLVMITVVTLERMCRVTVKETDICSN